MRLFFAVTLTEEILGRLTALQTRIRVEMDDPGIAWTRPEQLHFTIKFLGETQPTRLSKAIEAAQALATSVAPFVLGIGGIGAFPSVSRPSTLWVGATAGSQDLANLADELAIALANCGYPRERRTFTPHITLARIKTYDGEKSAARAIRRMAEDSSLADLGSEQIGHFTLYRSTLGPHGSVHEVIEEIGLGARH